MADCPISTVSPRRIQFRPDFAIREADAYYRMFCFSPEDMEKMSGALKQAGLRE
ncbi:hypothetical protein [Bradyrhizobium sp. USDA 4486]